MSSLAPRWRELARYLQVLIAPLLDLPLRESFFLVEAAGPDGGRWSSMRPVAVPLGGGDPVDRVVRVVATLCGASNSDSDPRPEAQRRRGVYYVPAALGARKRADVRVAALSAIVLDIDDRAVGGRDAVLRGLGRAPSPTALVRSGGGVQAAYVFREALVFDRSDERRLEATVRSYLRAAVALERLTGADETGWPSHLYRCPATYHLKDPSRPVLVTVELTAARRFNLCDFDELTAGIDDRDQQGRVDDTVARLLGRPGRPRVLPRVAALATTVGLDGAPRFKLPRRVSRGIIQLLNFARHPKYERRDGSLDRSRAVYAVAISLLGAGLSEEETASVIAVSALRSALDDRGGDAARWLGFQVSGAREYLARAKQRRRDGASASMPRADRLAKRRGAQFAPREVPSGSPARRSAASPPVPGVPCGTRSLGCPSQAASGSPAGCSAVPGLVAIRVDVSPAQSVSVRTPVGSPSGTTRRAPK